MSKGIENMTAIELVEAIRSATDVARREIALKWEDALQRVRQVREDIERGDVSTEQVREAAKNAMVDTSVGHEIREIMGEELYGDPVTGLHAAWAIPLPVVSCPRFLIEDVHVMWLSNKIKDVEEDIATQELDSPFVKYMEFLMRLIGTQSDQEARRLVELGLPNEDMVERLREVVRKRLGERADTLFPVIAVTTEGLTLYT